MIANLRISTIYAIGSVLVELGVLSPVVAGAQTQQELQCSNKNKDYSIDQRIAACTAFDSIQPAKPQ